MATIIDSLVIELGIDTKQLDEGQRQALSKLRELEGATRTHVKQIDLGFNQIIGTFKNFQAQLLGIGALIAGGLGLDKLVGDIARVNAQTGYLAKSLGQSNQELTRLQAAAMLMGQSKEDATGLATAIANNAASFGYGQGSSLRRLSGSYPGLNASLDALQRQYGANAPISEVLLALSKYATQEEKDPNRARYSLGQVGIPQGAINMALQGPDAVKKALQEAGPYAVTPEQLKNLQNLNIEFNRLMLAVERLTRALASSPDLIRFLESLTRIVDAFNGKGAEGGAKTLEDEASKGTGSFFGDIWGGTKRWIQRNNPWGGGGGGGGGTPPATFDERFRGAPGGNISSGGGDVDAAIRATASAAGMDEAHWKAIASIESSLNPSSNMNAGTQYKGLFQIGRSEWSRTGQGNIYNAMDNAQSAAKLARENRAGFIKHFGREPTPTEIYLMHQQGLGFYTNGTMTNIAGNPYPGMRGPQTPQSFEAGWGRELERRAARYVDKSQGVVSAGMPSWLPGSGSTSRLFDQWKGYNNMPSMTLRPMGGSTTNNTNSSQTSIGTMNVTVPPGSSPQNYGEGIRDHLQRVDPVYQSLTGMN